MYGFVGRGVSLGGGCALRFQKAMPGPELLPPPHLSLSPIGQDVKLSVAAAVQCLCAPCHDPHGLTL